MRVRTPDLLVVVLVPVSGAGLACASKSQSAPRDAGGGACVDTLPDGGPVQVTGQVVTALDDGGSVPLPGAMVVVEYGGLYLPWCDLSRASPYYVFGAVTDDAGAFTLTAGAGKLGFHAFADGQFYSRAPLDTSRGSSVTIVLAPTPAGQARPTITGAAFDATAVAPGAPVTVSATVAAATSTDPLSDETVLVEPTHSWGAELDPPSIGKKDDFPDGRWSRTFAAPGETGSYTYWLSATTAGCVSSDIVRLQLVVQ